jgi:hypothetical protein
MQTVLNIWISVHKYFYSMKLTISVSDLLTLANLLQHSPCYMEDNALINNWVFCKRYLLLGLLGGLLLQRAAILASWRAVGGNSRPSWRSFTTSRRSSAMASSHRCFSSADRQQNSSHLSRTRLYTFNPCLTITPNWGSENIFPLCNVISVCKMSFLSLINHTA